MKIRREGGFLIAKIHQVAGRIFAKTLRAAGIDAINPAQGRILFVLWRTDAIPISDLARRTLLSHSTLTSMLDRLEKAGYVRRVPSLKDRRSILIERTDKDRQLEEQYIQVSDIMTELFYHGFTPREIDTFEHHLRRILTNLTKTQHTYA